MKLTSSPARPKDWFFRIARRSDLKKYPELESEMDAKLIAEVKDEMTWERAVSRKPLQTTRPRLRLVG